MVEAIVLTLLMLPAGPAAQDSEFKMGVVHIEDVVEGSPDFQRASAEWTAVLEERTGEVQERQRELREAELLLTGADAPAGAERTTLINRIDRLRRDIERMSADVQQDLNLFRQQLVAPIVERVHQLVRTYGQENGYDLIIDTSTLGLALALQDVEITDELLEIIRAEDAGAEETPAAPETNP